jgi:hypothetical protein
VTRCVAAPQGDLLDAIATHAADIIKQFRPQAVSNTLWGYAKLGYMPGEKLMKAATQQMLADLGKCVPQGACSACSCLSGTAFAACASCAADGSAVCPRNADISNALWAFASLRYHPGAALLDGAAKQAVYSMNRFKPQEVRLAKHIGWAGTCLSVYLWARGPSCALTGIARRRVAACQHNLQLCGPGASAQQPAAQRDCDANGRPHPDVPAAGRFKQVRLREPVPRAVVVAFTQLDSAERPNLNPSFGMRGCCSHPTRRGIDGAGSH